MSRYHTTVEARIVAQAFSQAGTSLALDDEDVCLFFGYDYPLALYFLDVEDGDAYYEFAYGGRPKCVAFMPGTRLSRGQMLAVVQAILAEGTTCERLRAFQDAICMDLPV